MPDEKDAKLVTALKQVKQTPMNFAFVAKGTSEGVLIVSKKKIPAAEINKAKSESGGKAVFRGRCVWEEGKLVFEVAKEPPGTLAKQLKTTIQASAGMIMQVETHVAADIDESEEGEGQTQQQNEAPPTAPPAPPTNDELAARFVTRLKALAPILQKAEAAGIPGTNDAKLQIAAANKFYVAKQYQQAHDALDQAEAFLQQTPASPEQQQPQQGSNDGAATWLSRRKNVEPRLLQALKENRGDVGKMRAVFALAQESAEATNYPRALQSLDALEKLLQSPQGPVPGMQGWKTAREKAVVSLRGLAGDLAKLGKPEVTQALVLINSIIKNLTLEPTSQQQVVELDKYLAEDGVFEDACLAFDLRTPLVQALAQLKPHVTA